MNYAHTAILRSRTVMSLFVMIILAGLYAYVDIPAEANPDVSVPIIVVTVPHEGITPQDSERLLARPLELEIKTIRGVEDVNSYAAEGSATIVIQFDFSFDADQALIDVREAVNRARVKIPNTAEEPIIREMSAIDFPVITIALGGENVPDRVLYRLARDMKDELEGLPEVLEATLSGDREELLEAVIDPAQLDAYDVSIEELISAIGRNNRLIAAGAVDTGQGSFTVKVPSIIETAEDLLSIPVKATADGVITLSDVTTIRRTFKDALTFTRANGTAAVAVDISKRQGISLIEAVERVKERVEELRRNYPPNVIVSYMADQAPDTREQISTLQGNISTAMFLVLTVVVAAVGFRSGLVVALGIPFSFLFAFIIVNALGFTYNFMVMFGMLLGLGMLIDGAIVIAELAERKMSEGTRVIDAYTYAIQRMFWPVLASTGTTLAAFLPLMFWPGVTGGFMRYLPVTVFAVLTGSLAYALLFAPVLGALLNAGRKPDAHVPDNIRLVDEGRFDELHGLLFFYAKLLGFVARRPFTVMALTACGLTGILYLYAENSRGMQFFTQVDPQFTGVVVNTRGNFSASELMEIVTDVEQRVVNEGNVRSIYTRTGQAGFSPRSGGAAADQVGNLFIELTDRRTRDVSGFEAEDRFRMAISDIPGVRAEIQQQEPGPPVGKDIQIQLSGMDLDLLTSEARRIGTHLKGIEGLTGVDDTTPVPGIEWEITVDRAKAAMLGADVTSVGAAVQLVTNGILVGRYRPDDVDDEVDIRIRYPESYRGLSQLDLLRVSTRDGQVPISSFVERKGKSKVSQIFRQNGQRVMFVRADTMQDVLADDKVQEVQAWLDETGVAPGVKVIFQGANEEQADSMEFIGIAFTLSLLLMGVLLVTQFNSFYQALLILSSVIMSTVGVLLGLLIADQPFSAIMTGVGIVALAGIIVNNNIVLIDTFNYLRAENPEWSTERVVVQTGCLRLRPVFLTTFTTGFGLLPMALGISIDLINREVEVGGPVASFWIQLAGAIVSGLSFATLLTLIVTPAMLMAPTVLRRLLPGRRQNVPGEIQEPGVDAPVLQAEGT